MPDCGTLMETTGLGTPGGTSVPVFLLSFGLSNQLTNSETSDILKMSGGLMSEVCRSQSNVKPEEVSTVDSIIPGKLCVWLRKDITETVNSDGETVYDFLEKSFLIDKSDPISKNDLKMYWDRDPVDNSNIKNLGNRVSALEKLVFDKLV